MTSASVVFDLLAKDRASGAFNNVGNSANKTSSTMSKLGGAMKAMGKVAAVSVAAGAVVAGKALWDMGKAAAEDDVAAQKLAQALKNTAGATDSQIAATEQWITAQGKALGVTDDELRPALGRLATATGDVGKAQKLASIAMDVAAGTGKSLESVSTALMKAQNGQVSSLSRIGINTKNAAGETISFEQAQKRLANTFGGQAAVAAETTSGKFARLKLQLSEMGEEIGAKLLPVALKLADWFLAKGVPALEKFGGYLGDKLPPIFEGIKEVWGKVTDAFSGKGGKGDIGQIMGDIKIIITQTAKAIRHLWKTFGADLVDYTRTTAKNLRQIIGGEFKIIKGLFKVAAAVMKGDWKKAWSGILDIQKAASTVMLGIVRQLGNMIKTAVKTTATATHGIFLSMWTKIRELADRGGDWLVDQIQKIPGKIANLASKFKEVGGDLVAAIANGIKNAAGFASSFASQIWQAVRGAINDGIDRLNSLLEFTIHIPGPAPDVRIDPPNIGHLARGTNNWRGGLAIVGEEGPELVNLPRGSRVTPHRQSMGALRGLGGSGGGGDVHITIQAGVGDPVAIGREVERVMKHYARSVGRDVGGFAA